MSIKEGGRRGSWHRRGSWRFVRDTTLMSHKVRVQDPGAGDQSWKQTEMLPLSWTLGVPNCERRSAASCWTVQTAWPCSSGANPYFVVSKVQTACPYCSSTRPSTKKQKNQLLEPNKWGVGVRVVRIGILVHVLARSNFVNMHFYATCIHTTYNTSL